MLYEVITKKEIMVVDDEGNELILPKTEQIPSDYFRKGDTVKAVVVRVEMRNSTPLIILSRTSPIFLERLFELEVPEIFDGLIIIKNIKRIPGERAKVARITSYNVCYTKLLRIHWSPRWLRTWEGGVSQVSE